MLQGMTYFKLMSAAYYRTLFGNTARAMQQKAGSRSAYARMEAMSADPVNPLTEKERSFLALRDSFYMATVSETGWPYLQHRGGPQGFVKVLDHSTIGFADYGGNRQYLSVGNLIGDDRVSLFFMDYPNRRRLKLIGHARTVELDENAALTAIVAQDARIPERLILIDVVGFDWNCPQHITPRFTQAEIDAETADLREENEALRTELARLKGEDK
jgi:predicted pyridoxine 5'-phosphate oxidase superfamily flavin-nucleotide-binding protein